MVAVIVILDSLGLQDLESVSFDLNRNLSFHDAGAM